MLQKKDLLLTLSQRLILLACLFIFCYGITMVLVYLISCLLADKPVAAMRIGAVLQDVIAFILPSVAACMMITRKPAELMCLPKRINLRQTIYVLAILVISLPAMESLIYLNENLSFPDSMREFARMAREMEDRANGAMLEILKDTSVISLILNLLIVGVGAGIAEELLFRGTFQRILTTGGVNRHVAVWLVAVVFSALHFQFFGFAPRVLLGAYFGYLLLWSGSIWLPVLAHTLNNSIFVITAWYQMRFHPEVPFSGDSTLWGGWQIVSSVVFTSILLISIHDHCSRLRKKSIKE